MEKEFFDLYKEIFIQLIGNDRIQRSLRNDVWADVREEVQGMAHSAISIGDVFIEVYKLRGSKI